MHVLRYTTVQVNIIKSLLFAKRKGHICKVLFEVSFFKTIKAAHFRMLGFFSSFSLLIELFVIDLLWEPFVQRKRVSRRLENFFPFIYKEKQNNQHIKIDKQQYNSRSILLTLIYLPVLCLTKEEHAPLYKILKIIPSSVTFAQSKRGFTHERTSFTSSATQSKQNKRPLHQNRLVT